MWPRFWGASTKRCKDAGRLASGTSGAPEDAAARRVIAFQKPGEHCLEGHLFGAFDDERRQRHDAVDHAVAEQLSHAGRVFADTVDAG